MSFIPLARAALQSGFNLTGSRLLLGYGVTTFLGCIAFVLGMGLLNNPNREIALNTYNWSVPLFFAFGITSALVFIWKLIIISRDKDAKQKPLAWRFGLSLWAALAGIYVAATAIDHWLYYYGNKTGVLNISFLKHVYPKEANTISCSGYMLVRIEKDTAIYRCPDVPSITWGGLYTDQPFVPWPSYRQGKSVILKEAIEKMQKEADKNTKNRDTRSNNESAQKA